MTGFSVASEADSADLRRLTVDAAPDQIEIVRAVLSDLVSAGWSESHSSAGETRVEMWVPTRDHGAAARLRAALASAGLALDVGDVAQDTDWQDGLRRHHRPIDVRDTLRVRPPWEPVRDGVIDIQIEPGMAFGTGQHATTQGCLDLMLDLPVGVLLDVGCGSGVLAIAAAKLGHAPVFAIDNDPLAVEATVRNARANEVDLGVRLADGAREPLPECDAIVANITRLHIAALAEAVSPASPAFAILSGFLEEDLVAAIEPWLAHGFVERRRLVCDDWAAVALERS